MDNKHSNIPQGYKDSLLGVIPEDWKVKRLGELGYFLKGKGVPKDKITTSGYKCLTYGDIYTKYDIVLNNIRSFIDEETAIISEELRAGDILFAGSGETLEDIGKAVVYLDNDKVYAGGDIIILRQKKVNSLFLSYLLNSSKSNYQKYQIGQGHSVVHIYSSQLANLLISVPLLSEQQKIAEILSVWDKSIDIQTRLIASLQTRKRALLQQLLTGKKRLKGFSEDWGKMKLGEIGVFFKGVGVPKDKIITSNGHKCLTYGDLYTKYDITITGVKSYIDNITANQSKEIAYGDICFAGSGETKEEIGRCAVFVDDIKGYAGSDIIIFRAKGVNPITLSYILNAEYVVKQKSSLGQGHSVVHIYAHQLEQVKVYLPTLKEQNAISEILTTADLEIDFAKQKLDSLRCQKKGLMQVLLTGKKRVL
jgi:type I restriction enzyme S subunit